MSLDRKDARLVSVHQYIFRGKVGFFVLNFFCMSNLLLICLTETFVVCDVCGHKYIVWFAVCVLCVMRQNPVFDPSVLPTQPLSFLP